MQVKDVMRHDEVIAIRFEGKKGVLFTDIKLDRKMFEPKKPEVRACLCHVIGCVHVKLLSRLISICTRGAQGQYGRPVG